MNEKANKIKYFLSDIFLYSEFNSLIHELELIIETEFVIQSDLDFLLDNNISYSTRQKIQNSFDKNNNFFTQLKNFIQELKEYSNSLPKIEFTFAIHPNFQLIKELSLWLENNFGNKTLFELKYDKKLYGGAVIGVNGKYRNFTLRDYINL